MSAYVPQPYNELLDSSLSYAAQTLTDPQKAQALTNLGAASVAYVGANFAAISHNHSADHITSGALAKARQHAQTAYLDATSQVFAGAATFNGLLQINGAAGGASTYLQLLNNSGAIGILGSDASISGGNAADVGLSVYGDNELCLWTNSTRMIRVNDSGSTFYNAATFNGTATINKTGSNGLIVNNTAGNALAIFNASAAGETDNAYLIIQTGGSPRWYVGQSVSSLTGDFEIYGAGFGGSMLTLNRTTGAMTANAATFNGSVSSLSLNADVGSDKPLRSYRDSGYSGWYTGTSLTSNEAYYMGGSAHYFDVDGVHRLQIGNGSQFNGALTVTGFVNINSIAKLGDFTVATLPSAASNAGYEANVTDSSVTTFGSTVAGSGSSRVKVYSNGTNWTVQAA